MPGADGREAPPPLNHHQCRFGTWLDTEGSARHGSRLGFQAIEPLHRQAHALEEELLRLQDRHRNPDALARLDELHGLRDALLEQLKMLVRGNWP